MAVFLSTYVNRVDKKGRVSVPAPFRAVLGAQAQGIVVFRSLQHEALEACSVEHLELLSDSLEKLPNLTPEMYELIETTIFGGSQFLPFDGEGRVLLPDAMAQAAGLDGEAAFVGRRKTFQIWQPQRLTTHETKSRQAALAHDVSLSKIIAEALARRGGEGSGGAA
ncbi:MAG: division/cell wall cluster transcriptional repressor MraZ [Alphaproteobacteria bacterium]|nr:MAG: division/cell wall cluster transcriptional repressor MraZ [Alphaproteobacteria bacterium]